MIASQSGNFDIFRLLIEKGADVNAEDSKGRTAMAYAYMDPESQSPEIFNYLAEHGASMGKHGSWNCWKEWTCSICFSDKKPFFLAKGIPFCKECYEKCHYTCPDCGKVHEKEGAIEELLKGYQVEMVAVTEEEQKAMYSKTHVVIEPEDKCTAEEIKSADEFLIKIVKNCKKKED